MKNQFENIIVVLFLLGALSGCDSTERISSPFETIKIYPIGINGLWGYADEDGEIIIDRRYEEANFFSSGLASVKENGKYGYINRLGKFEIHPEFDSVSNFRKSAAFVSKKDKSFWINRKGRKIEGHSVVTFGGCVTPFEFVSPLKYFDKSGSQYSLKEEIFLRMQATRPERHFVADDFIFDDIIPFSISSAIVRKGEKYGVFNYYGPIGIDDFWVDEIIPKYQKHNSDGTLYEAHFAKVRVKNKWGVISDSGKIVIEPEYFSLEESIGIFYLVEFKLNHWGYMTARNKYFKQ